MKNKDNQDLQNQYDSDCQQILLGEDAVKEDNPQIDNNLKQEEHKNLPEPVQAKDKQENTEKLKDNKENNLEYRLNQAQKWGQSKNRALLSSKRKITEMVNRLKDNGTLEEDEVNQFLSSFEESDIDYIEKEEEKNPYIEIGNNLQKEFVNFKRYNKTEKDVDAHYAAFFNFFPMFTEKEKEESMNYLQDAKDNEAIEYVMTQGGELYDVLYKGVQEKGSVVKYLKDIHKRLEKAENRVSELSNELDSTTEKIYNKATDSKAKSKGKTLTVDEFYEKRFS